MDVVYVSAREAEDELFRRELMDKLETMAAGSYGCTKRVPRHWYTLRQAIQAENGKQHYISKARYARLCVENGVPEDQAPALLQLFNVLGVCFSYHWDEDRNELEDYMLLDPIWLTNAIYSIIREGKPLDARGRLSLSNVALLLRQAAPTELRGSQYQRFAPELRYTEEECRYVLDVAAAHNLCYWVDENTVFFPALCTTNSPREALTEPAGFRHRVEFLLRYSYLPDSVIHQLVVRCFRLGLSVRGFWHRGVILEVLDIYRAIVRMEDDTKLRIVLWAREGHQTWEFFDLLRRELLTVNQQLKLSPEEFVLDGDDSYSLISLVNADRGVGKIYGPSSGAERDPCALLQGFYDGWALRFLRTEGSRVRIPILPRIFHPCRVEDPAFREALHRAHGGRCAYCGKPVALSDLRVWRIAPGASPDWREGRTYLDFLSQRGFDFAHPDFVENCLPIHERCDLAMSIHLDVYSLLERHRQAEAKSRRILELMEGSRA